MKTFVVFFVALLVQLGSGLNLPAQNPCPPTPDFHSDAWIGPDTTTIVICVGAVPCTITVQYCYRRAGNTYNDIAITSISYDPACAPSMTLAQLGELAFNAAVNDRFSSSDPNYANIPLCPQTRTDWRIFSSGCYLRRNVGGGQIQYLPCAGQGQCFATYALCWDVDLVGCNDVPVPRIKTTKLQSYPTHDCPQWNPESEPCYEWCP